MELLALIQKGSPILVLGILFFLERINVKVTIIQEDIHEIKQGITWKDTCLERHEDIDRRLCNLERNAGLNGTY